MEVNRGAVWGGNCVTIKCYNLNHGLGRRGASVAGSFYRLNTEDLLLQISTLPLFSNIFQIFWGSKNRSR